MTSTIDRRLLALESRQGPRELVTIIRIIAMPGHLDAEPDHATVGGMTIHRMDGETADTFMARVEAEAAMAAKPGCVRMALVFPRVGPHSIDKAESL